MVCLGLRFDRGFFEFGVCWGFGGGICVGFAFLMVFYVFCLFRDFRRLFVDVGL